MYICCIHTYVAYVRLYINATQTCFCLVIFLILLASAFSIALLMRAGLAFNTPGRSFLPRGSPSPCRCSTAEVPGRVARVSAVVAREEASIVRYCREGQEQTTSAGAVGVVCCVHFYSIKCMIWLHVTVRMLVNSFIVLCLSFCYIACVVCLE